MFTTCALSEEHEALRATVRRLVLGTNQVQRIVIARELARTVR